MHAATVQLAAPPSSPVDPDVLTTLAHACGRLEPEELRLAVRARAQRLASSHG